MYIKYGSCFHIFYLFSVLFDGCNNKFYIIQTEQLYVTLADSAKKNVVVILSLIQLAKYLKTNILLDNILGFSFDSSLTSLRKSLVKCDQSAQLGG